MTAYPIRAAAALGSVLISLTIFHGVASLAKPRHAQAQEQMLAKLPHSSPHPNPLPPAGEGASQ